MRDVKASVLLVIVLLLAACGGSPQSNAEAMAKALEKSDYDTAERMLAGGVDVQYRSKEGQTLLHYALAFNADKARSNAIARKLIEQGVDVKAADSYGGTALHMTGDPELGRMILERGADVNALDGEGLTPLEQAQFDSNQAYRDFLIQNGGKRSRSQ